MKPSRCSTRFLIFVFEKFDDHRGVRPGYATGLLQLPRQPIAGPFAAHYLTASPAVLAQLNH
jgi:hypothetical protein